MNVRNIISNSFVSVDEKTLIHDAGKIIKV